MSLRETIGEEFDPTAGTALFAVAVASGAMVYVNGVPESVLDVVADGALLGVVGIAATFFYWGMRSNSGEMVHGTAHV